MITLTHPFKDKCDPNLLIGECNKLNTFCGLLEEQAESLKDRFKVDKSKGDALELMVEFLLKWQGHDTHIAIDQYEPIDLEEDYGVDGVGVSTMNGKIATVQVKYRQADRVLTAIEDHLTNFTSRSWGYHYVDPKSDKNMLLITTGKEVHHNTMTNMFLNKVRVINREGLRELTDKIDGFWQSFKESVVASRKQAQETKPIELRQHQQEAVMAGVLALKEVDRGIIESPTGTGKTFIQAGIIAELVRH